MAGSDPVWVETNGDGEEVPEARDADGRLSVLVELSATAGMSAAFAGADLRAFTAGGFAFDEEFAPVPLGGGRPGMLGAELAAGAGQTYVMRATVEDDDALDELRQRPDVMTVWPDTPIAPFQCPIPPCDCTPGTPKGTIAEVATYLGVPQVWAGGFRGAGIVVGVVDGGITAQGRSVKSGETSRRIPRVIGGWPTSDWGTEAARWNEHGNMCATDVLGMAPEAQLYDLRISGAANIPSTISRALQAFNWAIDQHRLNGTPHILSNSWGIFQENWDASYARDPNHPFTRKVVEALDEGIIVLFAAGNCGGTCPDNRCGSDRGPGRSIWGANSHPRVMTVGAVNKNEEFVGYSSQGPGALDPNKPDFCAVTHFTGYFTSDSGTSAATPILAGAVALFKQAKPTATQASIKAALKETAKDIGPAGFDQHSGAGIVRIKAAFDRLTRIFPPTRPLATCRPTIVGCPSVLQPCLPVTRPGFCPVTNPAMCQPLPTRVIGCVLPSSPPACLPPTGPPLCTPVTRACPTLACVPGPGLQAGWEAYGWPGYGQGYEYDPAWEAWYGYGEAEGTTPYEEQWYGEWPT